MNRAACHCRVALRVSKGFEMGGGPALYQKPVRLGPVILPWELPKVFARQQVNRKNGSQCMSRTPPLLKARVALLCRRG